MKASLIIIDLVEKEIEIGRGPDRRGRFQSTHIAYCGVITDFFRRSGYPTFFTSFTSFATLSFDDLRAELFCRIFRETAALPSLLSQTSQIHRVGFILMLPLLVPHPLNQSFRPSC
jgi:hypothetical protein